MGNFGVYFGKWGERGTVGGNAVQRRRIEVFARKISKCPVMVIAEANGQVEELLKQTAVPGNTEGASMLERRSSCEHSVVRVQEPKGVC